MGVGWAGGVPYRQIKTLRGQCAQAVRHVQLNANVRVVLEKVDKQGHQLLPRQCHGAVLMSTHAHADIVSMDTSAAAAMPGVLCVLTGADVVADGLGAFPTIYINDERGGPPGFRTLRPLLVSDRVRCVGDRVAFVVAETLQQARDAAEQILIDYAPLPAVMSAEEAIKPGALKIWDGCADNVSLDRKSVV